MFTALCTKPGFFCALLQLTLVHDWVINLSFGLMDLSFFGDDPEFFFTSDLSFFPVDLSFLGGHLQDHFYCSTADFRDKIQNLVFLCISWFLFSLKTSPQKRLRSGTCFFRPEFTELEIYETLSFRWKYLSFFATLSFFRTWVFLKMYKKKPEYTSKDVTLIWFV